MQLAAAEGSCVRWHCWPGRDVREQDIGGRGAFGGPVAFGAGDGLMRHVSEARALEPMRGDLRFRDLVCRRWGVALDTRFAPHQSFGVFHGSADPLRGGASGTALFDEDARVECGFDQVHVAGMGRDVFGEGLAGEGERDFGFVMRQDRADASMEFEGVAALAVISKICRLHLPRSPGLWQFAHASCVGRRDHAGRASCGLGG